MTFFEGENPEDDEEERPELPPELEDLEFEGEDWEDIEEDIEDLEEAVDDDLVMDAAPDGYEYAHHFDDVQGALNYVHDPAVPHGVLIVVLNEDGGADVYRGGTE